MTRRGFLFLCAGGFLLLVFVPMVLLSSASVTPEMLVARCEASVPGWSSYQEDVKGQIGARPVAEWRGALRSAQQEGDRLTVAFRLEEPWRSSPASLPVLIRLPDGAVLLPERAHRDEDLRLYGYALESASRLPWLEVQYPHHRDRLILDSAGRWQR